MRASHVRACRSSTVTLTRLRRMQKPMPPLAPEQITEANWTEHLGDEQCASFALLA